MSFVSSTNRAQKSFLGADGLGQEMMTSHFQCPRRALDWARRQITNPIRKASFSISSYDSPKMAVTSTFSYSETLHTIPILPLATFLKTLTSAESVARLQDVLVKHRSPESWERVGERMISSGDLPPPGCTPKPQVNLSDETNDDIGARDQNQNQEPDQDEDEESEERMESDRDPGIIYPSPPKTYIQEIRVDLRTLHPKAIFALESWRRETLGMEQLVMESREFAAGVSVGADAIGEGDCASPGVSYLPKSVRLSNLDILFRGDREESESTSTDETSSVEVTPIPIPAKASALVDGSSISAPAKQARIFKTYGSSKRLSSLSLTHSGFPTRIASLSSIDIASASPLLSPTLSEAEPENEKAGSRRIVGRERLKVVNASKEVSEQGSVAKKRGRGRPRKKAEGLSQPAQTFVELGEEIPTKSGGVEEKEEGKRGKERRGRRKGMSLTCTLDFRIHEHWLIHFFFTSQHHLLDRRGIQCLQRPLQKHQISLKVKKSLKAFPMKKSRR